LETDETNPLDDALGQNKNGGEWRGGENYMSRIKEELEMWGMEDFWKNGINRYKKVG
jgi:hypothetical protein